MSSVAFLGPEGTFSAIFARKRYGKRAEFVSCPTIESVFEKVGTRCFSNTLTGVTRFEILVDGGSVGYRVNGGSRIALPRLKQRLPQHLEFACLAVDVQGSGHGIPVFRRALFRGAQ
jgi:hypothetical protein